MKRFVRNKQRDSRRPLPIWLGGVVALLVLCIQPRAGAATVSWRGGTNNWNVATNWSSGSVPLAGDDVIITNLTRGALVHLSNSTPAFASLTVAGSATV